MEITPKNSDANLFESCDNWMTLLCGNTEIDSQNMGGGGGRGTERMFVVCLGP